MINGVVKAESESSHEKERKLYCTIVNSNALEVGLESDCLFDTNGGTIGSGNNNHWVLTDTNGEIYANHCEIKIVDNEYCLIDSSGKMTINHSNMNLQKGVRTVISANDIFSVGPYQIKTHFVYDENIDGLSLHKSTLSSIFGEEIKDAKIIPDEDEYQQGEVVNKVDPLLALDEHNATYNYINKNQSFEWSDNQGSSQSDYQYHMDAVMSTRSKSSHNLRPYQSSFSDPFVDDHLATGPVMRGLGVNLTNSGDTGEMQYVAEEIGASLQETIRGLLKIHKQVNDNHYGTMNKNFQPIVDNPLKMSLPYEETVHLMYDDSVSLVHLAPPAAIKESLDTIYNHQEAVHFAITEALDQILTAFSPETLMQRFNYYRASRKLSVEERESWAWKMYQAYYRELISNRQTGFQKLFWEIFDQVYDKKIRDLQRKNMTGDHGDE